jgi:hypothetical protein
MVRERLLYMMCVAAILALASASNATVITVGDFEGNLSGWWQVDMTLTPVDTAGVTSGSQALLVSGPGGWHIDGMVDAKADMVALGKKGVKVTADVTAFQADMTTTWMQCEIVINGTNDDSTGANNNIGWVGLGGQDVPLDGQTHTLTWVLPEALRTKIAEADQNISWFQLALISNLDGASATNYYIDNIQISYPDTTSVAISDFEDGFDGWGSNDGWRVGNLSLSATGATSGAQAMLVEGAGGWQQMAVINLKPYAAALANTGVAIAADVTAFEADMTTTWMQVGMVVNADAPIGWSDLGLIDVTRDGQPHTITWAISDALAAQIAEGVESLGWFELVLVSNVDGASTAKFYIDNIRITGVPAAPVEAPKSTDLVIGNWEQQLDGWVVGGGADANYSDTNGVTLGAYSLDVNVPTGAWNTDILVLNLLDPNNAAALAAFKINTKITVDVTRMLADWPSGTDFGVNQLDWDEILLILNIGGNGWQLDWAQQQDTNWCKQASWLPRNGKDETIKATWDYSQFLSQIYFDDLTYAEIHLGINANDADYTGGVRFYLDNMKLSGAGVVINPNPANNARDAAPNGTLSWSGGAYAEAFNVYVGTDRDEVLAASGATNPNVMFATVDTNSVSPSGLVYNTKYFWRVDAVNDVNPDSPWSSPVWTFTTARFDVLDDFESYTNESPHRVFQTWLDGLGFSPDEFFPDGYDGNGTGSAVGFDPQFGNIMETANVHGGAKAMPVAYDNADTKISEALRIWADPQNWTAYEYMTIWIRGLADNVPDTLYVKFEDSTGAVETEVNTDPDILTNVDWTEWKIPMADLSSVNLAEITEMTIGVGSLTSPKASSGTFYVDDIRLYPLALVYLDPDHITVQRTSVAPVIDGVGDGVWNDVAAIPMLIWDMSNTSSAEPESAADLSASFKVLYDDTYFYLFVDVNDSVIDTTFSDYQGDGIEVYFDGDYSHGDTYDSVNDNQIRITVADVALTDTQSTLSIEGTQFKVLRTATGYDIEAAFPMAALQIYPSADPAPILDGSGNPIPGTGIAPNNVIGFEMQINDDDGGGRQTLLRWHSDDNNSYQNPSLFGQARLVGTN